MSFKKRQIDVTITLGTGHFGETVGDTVTLRGHRVSCRIEMYGGIAQSKAEISIYGLPLDMINKLTTIGPVATTLANKNLIQIDAGNEGEALSTIYTGHIMTAFGEFDSAPDVPLVIVAYTAMAAALKPVGASSYKGTVDAADCMKDFAAEMDFTFENNGVSVPMSNPCFNGTTLDKIKECAQSARIAYSTDNRILAIWPKGGGYRKGSVPVISPDTGMIGYPTFGSGQLVLRTLFRPDLFQGGRFELKDSIVEPANGVWNLKAMFHTLETETPNGAWFTEIAGFRYAA